MELQLNNMYRISCTDGGRNFDLEKLEDVKDRQTGEIKQSWKTIGHYGKFLHALNQFTVDQVVADEDKTDVKELIALIKDTLNQNKNIVDECNINWDNLKRK